MALSNVTSAAAVAACLLAPCAARAQTAQPATDAAEDPSYEEVVVTATRFSESLRNVPVAVTVFDNEALERADVQDIRDIVKFSPGLANGGLAQSGVTRLAIRGIATQTGNGDDPISTYVDGIYLGKPISNVSQLLDVDDVQILRGPQGSLYGRNATGGAILLRTNEPVFEPEASVRASYGSFGRLRVQAVANAPIAENLAVRLAGAITDQKGWGINEANGSRTNSQKNRTVRGSIRFDPTESIKIVFKAEYETRDANLGYKRTNSVEDTPFPPYSDFLPFTIENGVVTLKPGVEGPYSTIVPVPVPTTGTPSLANNENFLYPAKNKKIVWTQHPDVAWIENGKNYLSDGLFRNYARTEGLNLALNLEFALSDSLTLKSSTGYQQVDVFDFRDTDNLGPTSDGGFGNPKSSYNGALDDYWQLYQAVSLQSQTDRLKWILGADFNAAQDDTLFTVGSSTSRTFNRIDTRTRAFAIFGQATYDLTDTLALTAGARYSIDRKEGQRRNCRGNGQVTGEFDPDCTLLTPTDLDPEGNDLSFAKNTWKGFTPEIRATWKALPELTIYGAIAKGFKSGGYSRALQNLPYGPEHVTAFELGFKSAIGRMLTVNVAGFYTDYRDLQVQSTLEPGIARTINADKAEVKGVEFEAFLRPGLGFFLQGTATYTDAKFKDFQEGVRVERVGGGSLFYFVQRAGRPLTRVPKYTASVRGGWSGPIGEMGTLAVDASYAFTSRIPTDDNRFRTLDPRHVVDARLTWTAPSDKLSLSLIGTNLTNKQYLAGLNHSGGGKNVVYTDPRGFFVEISTKF